MQVDSGSASDGHVQTDITLLQAQVADLLAQLAKLGAPLLLPRNGVLTRQHSKSQHAKKPNLMSST